MRSPMDNQLYHALALEGPGAVDPSDWRSVDCSFHEVLSIDWNQECPAVRASRMQSPEDWRAESKYVTRILALAEIDEDRHAAVHPLL